MDERKPKQVYTISGLLIPHKDAVWLWKNCRPFAQCPYEIKEKADAKRN